MLDTRDWQVAWEHNPGFTFISLAFTPDGKYLVGCGYDYRIWFWDASTGEVIRTLAGPSDATDIAFSGDGSRFITGHNGVSVLWDMATGSQLLTLKIGKSTVKSGGVVTISPNGRQIATGGGKIIIW